MSIYTTQHVHTCLQTITWLESNFQRHGLLFFQSALPLSDKKANCTYLLLEEAILTGCLLVFFVPGNNWTPTCRGGMCCLKHHANSQWSCVSYRCLTVNRIKHSCVCVFRFRTFSPVCVQMFVGIQLWVMMELFFSFHLSQCLLRGRIGMKPGFLAFLPVPQD